MLIRLTDPEDESAWAEFIAMYEPFVHRLARKLGLQDADASDVCQEVFRSVAGAMERWNPDPAKGSFRAWLFRIARNATLDNLANRRRHPQGTGDSAMRNVLEAQPERDEETARMFDAEYKRRLFEWTAEKIRGEFQPSTWLAFWNTAVEGKSAGDVASELGVSVGAVYVSRSRVTARLRERIAELSTELDLDGKEIDHAEY